MSRTTMYGFTRDGERHEVAEFKNSFGSAAFIWDAMSKRYLKTSFGQLMTKAELDKLWTLAYDMSISYCHRLVLGSTFDRMLVSYKNFDMLAGLYDSFTKQFPPTDTEVCHLPAIAAKLRELAVEGKYIAVGWQQTSVAEEMWWVDGPEDPETGDHPQARPYNLHKDHQHLWLSVNIPSAS